MKKYIISGLILIVIGFIIGNYIFSNQKKLLAVINPQEAIYFLQEGIYSNRNNLNNNTKNLNNKVIEHQNKKYYVYVGITKNKKVAEKLKNIYTNKGYQITIKEKNKVTEEFIINVEQFDLLLEATNDEDEILTIEEIVLANYQETSKNISKKLKK